jgi:hypothetical protein
MPQQGEHDTTHQSDVKAELQGITRDYFNKVTTHADEESDEVDKQCDQGEARILYHNRRATIIKKMGRC